LSPKNILSSQQGFTLVSAVVTAAVLGILAVIMASMLISQHKQLNFLAEKGDLLQFQTVTRDTFNKFPQSCTPNIVGKTIDLSNVSPAAASPATALNLQELRGKDGALVAQVGQVPAGFMRQNKVKSIALTGLQGAAGSYVGKFVVTMDEKTTALPLKPVEVEVRLTANGNQVTGCTGRGNQEGELTSSSFDSSQGAIITGANVSGPVSGVNKTKAPIFFSIKNNDEKANCDFQVNGTSVGGFRVTGKGLASVRGNATTSAMVPPGASYSSNCDRGDYSFSAVPMDPTATKETVGATQGSQSNKSCVASGNSCELTCTTTNSGNRYVAGGSVSGDQAPLVSTEPDPNCSVQSSSDPGYYGGGGGY